MARPSRYSPEVREQAVRMAFECEHEHSSQWAAILSIAQKMGCTPETLRTWVRRSERTKFSARRRIFSPKRSSTGDRDDDSVCQRTPRRLRSRCCTIRSWRVRSRWPDSSNVPSGKAGAVHGVSESGIIRKALELYVSEVGKRACAPMAQAIRLYKAVGSYRRPSR